MVSTRGGTRTTGADDKKQSTLQKKPVRKTTAKAAPAAAKAKTTRSKKAEPQAEQLIDYEEEDEIQLAEPQTKNARRAQPAKPEPAKRTTTRLKKDEAPKNEAAAKPATRTAKSGGTTSTAKSKTANDEKPDLSPPVPGPAKSTRATRATRATAAKERVPPLSPKKITQVSKAPAKGARPAPKAKAPAAPSRSTTRRRNVSDENAEVLATSAAIKEPESKSSAGDTHKNKSKSKAVKEQASKLSLVEDETPASSRPTTPSDGVGQSFDYPDDEVAEESEEEQEAGDDFEDCDHTNNTSQDELCGPKTPMKRSSPRFGSRKAGEALDLDVPSKTPARRFAVLGTQQGTPQTTRPYRQPNIPSAAVGPTTVSRARDRAMVLPRLQPLDLGAADSEDDQEHSDEDADRPLRIDADVEDVDADVSVQQTTASTNDNSISGSDATYLNESQDPFHEGDDVVMEDQEDADQSIDAEETIVVPDDDELDSVSASVMNSSFNSNESVIVTRPALTLKEAPLLDESMQVDEAPGTTPKPETLVWENIRQDATIPFNFDVDMSLSRSLPEVEHNDRLSIANAFAQTFQNDQDTVAGAEQDQDTPEGTSPEDNVDLVASQQRDAFGLGRESLDATVNLSDFIDVKSLSESRRTSKVPSIQDAQKGTNEDAHDVQSYASPSRATLAQAEAVLDDDAFEIETPAAASHKAGDAAIFSHMPLTPARDVAELDVALMDLQQPLASNTPRYAMPTISSRRKSLPAKLYPGTLLKDGVRPHTSDGSAIMGLATPSRALWRTKTPLPSRPSTARGQRSARKSRNQEQTPRASKTPLAKTPGTSVPLAWQPAAKDFTPLGRTPTSRTLFARTPATSVPEVRSRSVKERFPGLPSRSTYEVDSVAPSAPAISDIANASPKERFPAMPSRDNYEASIKTPHSASTSVPTAVAAMKSAPKERFPGLPSKETYEELSSTPEQHASEQLVTPETAADQYSGLPQRRRYEEYAKTAMPSSRFRTPSQSPAKRPATVQKQASLRKVALKAASTPAGSRTPVKTPLKVPAFTPGQVPMTPHPSAPLRGVVALVEVYTSDGDCATPAFVALLQRLGAKTTKTFSERLTHVVYKEGSPNTLQRLRIHNKQVEENGTGKEIYCVNSRWVTDCDAHGTRMSEADEAYAVEVDDVPRTAKRRRKSMEPMSLTNVKGSVFRNRQSSLGRSFLGRAPLKMDSPTEEETTPVVNVEDKENSGDDGSPATPAYLAAPNSLVQQTAPLNKVRKLDFKSQAAAKSRRLTFWNGGN